MKNTMLSLFLFNVIYYYLSYLTLQDKTVLDIQSLGLQLFTNAGKWDYANKRKALKSEQRF